MVDPDDPCCVFSRGSLIDTMCLCVKSTMALEIDSTCYGTSLKQASNS